MQFSTILDGFEQKDSQGFENSYNSYEQYPLEKFLIFTIYQNYTLALILLNKNIRKTQYVLASKRRKCGLITKGNFSKNRRNCSPSEL